MKKIIILVLIFVFCVSAFVFDTNGEKIRAALAPNVMLCGIKWGEKGILLPESAITYDEESGKTYIFAAVTTDKYPEGGYEAKRIECEIYGIENGEADVFFMLKGVPTKSIIASADKKLTDGRMVIISGYLDNE